MNRSLLLLALCQGFFLTNNVVFIAINGLVGLQLAPLGWMATLPVTGYVVGSALSAGLVAKTQSHFGRKRSFQFGLVIAALSAALCAYAAVTKNFWLLVAATVVAGYYNANATLYRFAGPELVAPEFKERAISLVLAGGILGAFAGPNLANATRSMLDVPFAAAYLSLVGVALLSLAVLSLIRFPEHHAPLPGASSGRPFSEIVRQPVFIVAVAAGALGYGVMNLLMAATPIAMAKCGLPFSDAALVLEWHVLGMFVPSFFTGHLIKRVRRAAGHGRRRAAQPGVHRRRAVGRRADAISRRAVHARRRLEFSLRRRLDAAHAGLPAGGKDQDARSDGLLRLHDDGRHVVRLRRADHDARLGLAQLRLAASRAADRDRAAVARRLAAARRRYCLSTSTPLGGVKRKVSAAGVTLVATSPKVSNERWPKLSTSSIADSALPLKPTRSD